VAFGSVTPKVLTQVVGHLVPAHACAVQRISSMDVHSVVMVVVDCVAGALHCSGESHLAALLEGDTSGEAGALPLSACHDPLGTGAGGALGSWAAPLWAKLRQILARFVQDRHGKVGLMP
jgi:hypothetical protein